MSVTALGGCAHKFIPPDINYDSAVPAKLTVDPPAPVKIVELPKPLPLPGQLKPLDGGKPTPEAADPDRARQPGQRRRARSAGAQRLHQRRAGLSLSRRARSIRPTPRPARSPTSPCRRASSSSAPGRSPPATPCAGSSATPRAARAPTKKVHILVKPTRPELVTNLVINTDRRTYLLELRSTEKTYMASVSWQYPGRPAHRAAPAEPGGRGGGADRHRRRSRRDQLPLCDPGRQSGLAAAARLRRRPEGLHRIPDPASARARCRRSSSSARPAAPSW